MFVDCANYEYSRDIEMMRGGYFDNYYMQLCDYTARLKGKPEPKIHTVGDCAEYLGFPDGDFSRCHEGYGTTYVNRTQRHAITKVTVSHTADAIEFAAETKSPIDTTDTCGSFLWIFLQTKGAAGHNFILNRTFSGDKTTLAAVDDTYKVKEEIPLPVKADGNRMVICCPLRLLGLTGETFEIRFKVCDSRTEITSAEDFYDKGDCLPTGRLDFVYRGC